LRRSDSIRNSCSASHDSRTVAHWRNYRCKCGRTSRPGRRERNFWMQRQGAKNSSRKSVNACRDQSPESKWPEIPAEAPYLASIRERVVCGDWMVETVGFELAAPPSHRTGLYGTNTATSPKWRILHNYALPGNIRDRMDALSSGPLSLVAPPRRLGSHSARHDFLVAFVPPGQFRQDMRQRVQRRVTCSRA
jgi:hypothetical protein